MVKVSGLGGLPNILASSRAHGKYPSAQRRPRKVCAKLAAAGPGTRAAGSCAGDHRSLPQRGRKSIRSFSKLPCPLRLQVHRLNVAKPWEAEPTAVAIIAACLHRRGRGSIRSFSKLPRPPRLQVQRFNMTKPSQTIRSFSRLLPPPRHAEPTGLAIIAVCPSQRGRQSMRRWTVHVVPNPQPHLAGGWLFANKLREICAAAGDLRYPACC